MGQAATISLPSCCWCWGRRPLPGWLRRALDTPSAARASPWGWRSAGFVLASALATVASFQWLDMPLRALWSGESLHAIVGFVTSFFPLDLSAPWLRKIALGTWETLAMSVVGTLLVAAVADPAGTAKVRWPCALVLNTLRSVPELVWATITVLCGPGPVCRCAGAGLAHGRVLGRLYAEALANAPQGPAPCLVPGGASGSQGSFLYGTLPGAAPQLIATLSTAGR